MSPAFPPFTPGRLRVIDAHVHVGGPAERAGSPEQILQLLESVGAEQAVCLPAPGIEPDNEELERLLQPYRRRLHPCVWVNPLAGERSVATVRKYAVQGWRAMKLQPAMHQFSLLSAPALKVVEEAVRHNLLTIVHTGGASVASPWAVGELARRYPEARFVIDHMGGADMGTSGPPSRSPSGIPASCSAPARCLSIACTSRPPAERLGAAAIRLRRTHRSPAPGAAASASRRAFGRRGGASGRRQRGQAARPGPL